MLLNIYDINIYNNKLSACLFLTSSHRPIRSKITFGSVTYVKTPPSTGTLLLSHWNRVNRGSMASALIS